MPFNPSKFRTACIALLFSHTYACNLYAIKISDSLIESSILINLDNIEGKLASPAPSRRYSSAYISNEENATISLEIDKNLDDSSGTTKVLPGLINDLSTVFSGIPFDSKIDGFDHSIHYLVSINNQNFSRDDLITMIKSSVQALIQSDINDGQNDISGTIGNMPKINRKPFFRPTAFLIKLMKVHRDLSTKSGEFTWNL